MALECHSVCAAHTSQQSTSPQCHLGSGLAPLEPPTREALDPICTLKQHQTEQAANSLLCLWGSGF